MAVLKQIKFGTGAATPIAKTVVKAASESVLTVTNSNSQTNDVSEEKDYSYDVDIRIDNDTLVKSNDTDKVLKVGKVPAAQVTVAEGAGITAIDAQAAFKELKDAIDTTGGAAKSYKIVEVASPASTKNLKEYKVQVAVGTGEFADDAASATIVVPKDQHLKDVELVNEDDKQTAGQFLKFTYVLDDGSDRVVYLDVSKFLTESEFGDGLSVSTAGVVSVKIDENSENFLTVSADGVKLSGVQAAIDAAVATLDVTNDNAIAGQYVAAIQETDGVVSVKERANVSDAVLNGYAKGEKPDSTAIAATDDVKGAIAKLEHQIDDAKAAATTKVVEGTDEGNNMTIVPDTGDDHSVTYTINLTDVASKAALDAEIAARKAVDGQDGQTYAANSGTNYISDATSLNDADIKLDAAIKAEVARAESAETAIDGAVGLTKAASGEGRTYTNSGEYIGKQATNTVTSDIKALDTQLKTVSDKLAAVQYQVNGTTLEFFGISEKTGA